MILLQDDEWSQWSNVKIAERCAVDEKTVRKYRGELSSENPKIDYTTLKQPSVERKVERNGTIYTQNTSNIGKTKQQPAVEPKYHPEVITAEVSYDDVRMSGERR